MVKSIKKVLTSAPFLVLPNFRAKFVLDTDASADRLRAVLSQVVGGRKHVIAYAQTLQELSDAIVQHEKKLMLALVWVLHHFRPYLYEGKFLLQTDYSVLQWLRSLRAMQVARWLEGDG